MRTLAAIAVAMSLVAAPMARALDSDRSLRQYVHKRWTRAEGAPSSVVAIAQTRDGYLWLSSPDGLFRFDGLTFERIDRQFDLAVEGPPSDLLVTSNGDLWIYYSRLERFYIFRQGVLRAVPTPPVEGPVIALAQTPNGDIWVARGFTGQPMLRYRKGRWSEILPNRGFEPDDHMGMVVAADGALWVAFMSRVFRLRPDGSRFDLMLSKRDDRMRLSLDPAGRVWVTDNDGSAPLTEPRGRWTGRPATFRYPSDRYSRRGTPLFDREGNLWIGTAGNGLERYRKPSPVGPTSMALNREEFRARDGLTADGVSPVFEDREGNIWVGTGRGLDQFRNASVAAEPALTAADFATGDILFADSRGDLYIANGDTIYLGDAGASPRPLVPRVGETSAICEGPDRAIWIVSGEHALVLGRDGRRRVALPNRLRAGISDCAVDRWGRFWFTAGEDGLYEYTASGWRPLSPRPGGEFSPTTISRDPDGDLWVETGESSLARLDPAGPTVFNVGRSTALGPIRTILPLNGSILLVGTRSIGRLHEGRLLVANKGQFPLLVGVNGAVQTPTGESWFFGRDGIARMRTSDIVRAFEDRNFRVPFRIFDFLDGLPDRSTHFVPRSLVQGADGRLWAATGAGTAWLDPSRIASNPLAPGVAIATLEAGGQTFRDPRRVRLEAGAGNVSIRFAALSLGVPERVRVLYKLEGQDNAWIDPGTRRLAFYTNLDPGTYRFQVIAANEDGVWNRQGSTLEFTIPPTFIQSIWFKVLLGLILAALLGFAYLLRLRQVTARLQRAFDVRIAERERISRELHDTLLQGFQGLLLQFKAATARIPAEDGARKPLDEAIERAQGVLVEGRDRVRDLRNQEPLADFTQSLLATTTRLVGERGPSVRLSSEGNPRALRPLVQEELERVAEEAVRNAVSHARAAAIEISILWGSRELRVAIRDDGIGMPESILLRGERSGHFGLVGMRERVRRVGGKFIVTSLEGTGTEAALTLPARAAYRDHPVSLRERLWLDLARWMRGPSA